VTQSINRWVVQRDDGHRAVNFVKGGHMDLYFLDEAAVKRMGAKKFSSQQNSTTVLFEL